MHGTIGKTPVITAVENGEGWHPYIPGIFSRKEVVRQLGHKPTLYVMRKREGGKWIYRPCTPQESSEIEAHDA